MGRQRTQREVVVPQHVEHQWTPVDELGEPLHLDAAARELYGQCFEHEAGVPGDLAQSIGVFLPCTARASAPQSAYSISASSSACTNFTNSSYTSMRPFTRPSWPKPAAPHANGVSGVGRKSVRAVTDPVARAMNARDVFEATNGATRADELERAGASDRPLGDARHARVSRAGERDQRGGGSGREDRGGGRAVWARDLRGGPGVLQRELRHLYAARWGVHAAAV